MTLIVLLIASVLPPRELPEDRVDAVELNHYYSENGKPIFDQLLFFDWCPVEHRYQVRDWRLVKNRAQIPRLEGSEYVAVWSDFKEEDAIRVTRAKVFYETWTQWDPEVYEREFLPDDKRKRLKDLSGDK